MLIREYHSSMTKQASVISLRLSAIILCVATAAGQSEAPLTPAAEKTQAAQPVSYASLTELNGLLAQLEATSKNTQADLPKLRIDRWKTSGASKKETLAKVDSIQRDLQGTLPDVISQLRAAPENLPATFKLYRNLGALCDVVGSVAEDIGAFGSKDELQTVTNDLDSFDSTRKQMAQRMDSLSTAKEAEIVQLRTSLKAAQAVAEPPKKIVVDDTAPPKKPVVKKKLPKAANPTPAKPSAGQSAPTADPAKQ